MSSTVTNKAPQNGANKSSKSSTTDSKSAAGKVPAKRDAAEELKEFLVDGLKDLYWAEKALVKALPKMQKNATNEELKAAIGTHLEQTKNQVVRLESCFEALGEKAQAKKCDAMEGIIKEGEGILEETEPGSMRDVGIIAASQKVEHYEIASYGTLAAFAKILKEEECLKQLLATLAEEKETDELLTSLADTHLNSLAL